MKRWRVILTAAVLAMMTVFPAAAANGFGGPGSVGRWLKSEDGRWYYENPDKSFPTSQMLQIENSWYYFDEEGYMKTGWIQHGENRYYADETGALAMDKTLTIGDKEYTFDEKGICKVNYKKPTVIPSEEEKSETHHTVDAMADKVLAQITNDQMSKTEKATAIYSWVRGNIRYVSTSEKEDWVKAAYNGFRKKSGDCYTYYAVALALLSRADIPSIEVVRLDGHHWWNLIDCGEGWYHFDTTPRSSGGTFCLLTDAQLMDYSNKHVTRGMPYGSHGFDTELYPPTPQ